MGERITPKLTPQEKLQKRHDALFAKYKSYEGGELGPDEASFRKALEANRQAMAALWHAKIAGREKPLVDTVSDRYDAHATHDNLISSTYRDGGYAQSYSRENGTVY